MADSSPDGLGSAPASDKRSEGYRVLARKYRPRNFDDLVGQDAMVRTLRNAFAANRIAQAFMLTGVRGVGKTTTARILARALNYETDAVDRPTLDMAEPGRHCQAIMEGRHPDVLELDAASHNGVEAMRDLIANVQYRPMEARTKVYIIDEVHMLSTPAFNALLKTLEEPPGHAKFIFATTEIRKVPVTILSRCQRFDLRRIEAETVRQHLARVARLEEVEAEDDALALIARAGEGSMRDALSLLDQAIAYGEGRVDADATRDMLGLADRARTIGLFEAVSKGDTAGALTELHAQNDLGADPAVVIADLLDICHLVTRLKTVPSARDDRQLTQDERERGGALADRLHVGMLSRAWQILLKGLDEVRGAPDPLDAADMVLVRLAHASTLPTPEEALRAMQGEPRLEREPADAAAPAAKSAPTPAHTPAPAPAIETPATTSSAPASQDDGPRSLRDIYALADGAKQIRLSQALWSDARVASFEAGHIRIAGLDTDLARDLQAKLKVWTGEVWTVEPVESADAATLKEIAAERRARDIEDIKSDPTVAAVLAALPGAEVDDILDTDD